MRLPPGASPGPAAAEIPPVNQPQDKHGDPRDRPGNQRSDQPSADRRSDQPPPDQPAADNPYATPAASPPAVRPPPKLAGWVLGFAVVGAVLGFMADLLWLQPLSMLGPGPGGLLAGGLAGAILGRVTGRLVLASHAMQAAAYRRAELMDEVQQRRQAAQARRRRGKKR